MSLFERWKEENFEALSPIGPKESEILWNNTLELIASAVGEEANKFAERHHGAVIRGWKELHAL